MVEYFRNTIFVLILIFLSSSAVKLQEMNGGLIVSALLNKCMYRTADHKIFPRECDDKDNNQKFSIIKISNSKYRLVDINGADIFPSECYKRLNKVPRYLTVEPYNDQLLRFRFENTNNCIDFTRDRRTHSCDLRVYECSKNRLGQAFSLKGGGYVPPQPKFVIRGYLKNGTTGRLIANTELQSGNIKITFTNNANSQTVVAEIKSGSVYQVELTPGTYTINTTLDNYIQDSSIRTYTQASNEVNEFNTLLLSPKLNGWRFILSWNNKVTDLDLHLILPTGENIFWGNLLSRDKKVQLDVDDQDGGGPETITINGEITGQLRLFSENYSKEYGFKAGEAVAKIYYNNNLLKTISVSNLNTEGSFWNIAKINGSTGEVTEINTASEIYPIL